MTGRFVVEPVPRYPQVLDYCTPEALARSPHLVAHWRVFDLDGNELGIVTKVAEGSFGAQAGDEQPVYAGSLIEAATARWTPKPQTIAGHVKAWIAKHDITPPAHNEFDVAAVTAAQPYVLWQVNRRDGEDWLTVHTRMDEASAYARSDEDYEWDVERLAVFDDSGFSEFTAVPIIRWEPA